MNHWEDWNKLPPGTLFVIKEHPEYGTFLKLSAGIQGAEVANLKTGDIHVIADLVTMFGDPLPNKITVCFPVK